MGAGYSNPARGHAGDRFLSGEAETGSIWQPVQLSSRHIRTHSRIRLTFKFMVLRRFLASIHRLSRGGRPASDLMHELAHIIIGHEPARVDVTEDGALIWNSHDQRQEDEANWLSGCLLLPREALSWIRRQRLDDRAAARYNGGEANRSRTCRHLRRGSSGISISTLMSLRSACSGFCRRTYPGVTRQPSSPVHGSETRCCTTTRGATAGTRSMSRPI